MKKKKTIHAAASISIGIAIAVAMMLIITLIYSALLLDGKVSESPTRYLGLITNILASTVGLSIIGKTSEDKAAIRMGIGALTYIVITIGIKVLVLDDGLQNCWKILLSVIIGYVLSCAIYIRKSKKKRYRKKRI